MAIKKINERKSWPICNLRRLSDMGTLVKKWIIKITMVVENMAKECLEFSQNDFSIATKG